MTKARTKAQRRAGRPRETAVTITGHPAEHQDDPRSVTLLSRCKALGWRPTREAMAKATDQRAGTPIGRMALNGHITERQRQAVEKYHEVVAEYRKAICAPKPSATNATLDGISSGSGDMSEERITRAVSEYHSATDALASAGKPATIAVNSATTHEPDPIKPSDKIVHRLVTGANALAAHFRLPMDDE